MTLLAYVNWISPSGPALNESGEVYIGRTPLSNTHPPSLKNPLKTKIPTAQDGWKKNSPEALKRRAKADMAEILKRTRRQIGKPEIAHVAPMPFYPTINQWQ